MKIDHPRHWNWPIIAYLMLLAIAMYGLVLQ